MPTDLPNHDELGDFVIQGEKKQGQFASFGVWPRIPFDVARF